MALSTIITNKLIQLEQTDMTPEQWKQEFRKELEALREPIERLDALLKLYPYKLSCNSAIRETLASLANEPKKEEHYRIDADCLEKLYQLLALLPKPDAYLDWLKKQYEVSEVQHFALTEFIDFCSSWGDYDDVHKMEELEKDKILENIATRCEYWQKLLGMIQDDENCEQVALFRPNHPHTSMKS